MNGLYLLAFFFLAFLFLSTILSFIFFMLWPFVKKLNGRANPLEIIIGTLYLVSLLVFWYVMGGHDKQYYTPIKPEIYCYTPFAGAYFTTLNTYFILFNVAALIIWLKGIRLPPILLVLLLTLLFIGLVINTGVIWQLTEHDALSNEIDLERVRKFYIEEIVILEIIIETLHQISHSAEDVTVYS